MGTAVGVNVGSCAVDAVEGGGRIGERRSRHLAIVRAVRPEEPGEGGIAAKAAWAAEAVEATMKEAMYIGNEDRVTGDFGCASGGGKGDGGGTQESGQRSSSSLHCSSH
jgi:hypothetical protein